MEAQANTITHHVPAWLIRICRAISTTRGFIWSGLLTIALSLIATWLFTTSDSDFGKFPLTRLFQHWYITVTTFLVLAALTGFAWAIGKLPTAESPRALKRRYLTRRILQTQDLAIEGIPLMPPRVLLDEIFIPLPLQQHQSTIDQLLTREQSQQLREGIQRGRVAKEVESVLIDAERQHELLLRNSPNIVGLEDLWRSLTKEHPAAVLQGYPGMGKSTLLLRLTLYMARRGRGQNERLGKQFSPVLIPIFIRLGRYATYRKQASTDSNPSIWKYLSSAPDELDDLASPDMRMWLRTCLERGQCLVLFDGLDEVSDPLDRAGVQRAIRSFITDVSSKASRAKSFNRFLITSRVAGYDKNAFPGYLHYTIAELTSKHIKEFLPRWCRASVRGMQDASRTEVEDYVSRQAAAIEQKLRSAIESHQGIGELVKNPFLLTLLAIMQQNGIELPDRRVELYSVLIQVLLETRNTLRGLPVIAEAKAVQRLGPVAHQMQATKNSFATRNDVLKSFSMTIEQIEKLPWDQAQQEAVAFLERVRERGGIFVLRTGDYYGFFHRTFQEYFAARHLLRTLATDPDSAMDDLLQKARQPDDLWREPFLLAVAYKTSNEAPVAWQIIRKLLTTPPEVNSTQRYHDVLLAGECLIEAKESTIPHELERDIVLALLLAYEDAQHSRDISVCEQVEDVIRRLLLGVASEAEHSSLLLTFQESMLDTQHPPHQRAVLTLLILIAQNLLPCAPVVFTKLVPSLLGLTELPAVGNFSPVSPTTSFDPSIVDLALAALSFMGTRGPTGASLLQTRPHFEDHLQQLTNYSLQSGFLITPTVVPLATENYSRYNEAVNRWRLLHFDARTHNRITEPDRIACLRIQQDLLQCAEEVCYPAETHLLHMLQRSQALSDQDWKLTWQEYLLEQMDLGTYIEYSTSALLWTKLFSSRQEQQMLTTKLLEHLNGETHHRRYAQRFLLNVVYNLYYLRDRRELRELSQLGFMDDLEFLKEIRYLKDFKGIGYLRDSDNLKYLRDLRYLLNLFNLKYLKSLSDLVFTEQVAIEVRQRLPICTEIEQPELLTLLFGRVLQIQEANESGPQTDQEIQNIVQATLPFASEDVDARGVVFAIARYLPTRTGQEIAYVLDLAYGTSNKSLQIAYAEALGFSAKTTNEAWSVLESARTSSITEIRRAVENRLLERKLEKAKLSV